MAVTFAIRTNEVFILQRTIAEYKETHFNCILVIGYYVIRLFGYCEIQLLVAGL